MNDDSFPGFPVGETKEEFQAALDRLMDWRDRQPVKPSFAYGHNLPIRWGHVLGHVLACPRTPVARLIHLLPIKYIEALEHNQQIAHCCRHPERHTIEAWFSCAEEEGRGTPDIYINHCTCGRRHVRFCVGIGDERPVWR